MNLQYHQATITPFEVAALHNLIAKADEGQDKEIACKWLNYVRSGLYAEWQALPNGNHLKEVYRDMTWQWDDQDLAGLSNTLTPEEVRAIGNDMDATNE